MFLSCGGGANQPASSASSETAISITVTPSRAQLAPGQSQQFTATVKGADNNAVLWKVDNVQGGNSTAGTISNGGLYTAPSSAGQHSVSASSVADPTRSAGAQITVTATTASAIEVLTERNDNARTGLNSRETVLTPSNVNPKSFGKIASYPIDGYAYAQPLYAANVNVPGKGTLNVVFIATEHDSVYAFDGDGKISGSLWHRSFIDPASGVTTVQQAEVNSTIYPEIGITSTPVIDRSAGILYVVALTEENGSFFQRIHALDLATGQEKLGGPVTLTATTAGITFDPKIELQRTSLLLLNHTLYIAFASHGDTGPYHGWILAYDASTLKQTGSWLVTPNGVQGGIWTSGCGLSVDGNGNIYAVTGNGTFSASSGGSDYGDSVVKLTAGLNVLDYFTPYNQATLSADDLDLGSSGFMLIPGTTLGTTAGKGGTVYLLNTSDMGHYNTADDSQVVQTLPGAIGTGTEDRNFSTATYFNGFVYYIGQDDTLKQFQLVGGKFDPFPTAVSAHTFGAFGAQSAVSANGSQNGILWVIERVPGGSGILYAYDATNISKELYDSNQSGSRDNFATATRFSVPTIVDGKVYVGGASQLAIFGLLNQ